MYSLRLVSPLIVAVSNANQTEMAAGPLAGEAGHSITQPASATDLGLTDKPEPPPSGPEARRPDFLSVLLRALSVWTT